MNISNTRICTRAHYRDSVVVLRFDRIWKVDEKPRERKTCIEIGSSRRGDRSEAGHLRPPPGIKVVWWNSAQTRVNVIIVLMFTRRRRLYMRFLLHQVLFI